MVEYYREQWQLWLTYKRCQTSYCEIVDLVPCSWYKFRVRCVSSSGAISPPSKSTPTILYDRRGTYSDIKAKKSTQEWHSIDNLSPLTRNERQASLDKEVHYVDRDQRIEITKYSTKFKNCSDQNSVLNPEDKEIYRNSLSALCLALQQIDLQVRNNPSQKQRKNKCLTVTTNFSFSNFFKKI